MSQESPPTYEFWDTPASYSSLFDNPLAESDREAKRRYFGKELLLSHARPIKWMDIGSGDGAKLADVVTSIRNLEPTTEIVLSAIEASAFGAKNISDRFRRDDHLALRVFNEKFDAKRLPINSFDAITFFHSSYYLAVREPEFQKVYSKCYAALRRGGVLIIQSVDEHADFQKLGNPPYSEWAQGEHSYELLSRLNPHVLRHDFPTRIDVSDLLFLSLKDLSSEQKSRLLLLYRFTTQQDSARPTPEALTSYVQKLRSMARKDNGRYVLDFSDVIVSIRKT